MSQFVIRPTTKFFDFSYQNFLKPILFQLNAETIHHTFTQIGYQLGKYPLTRQLTQSLFSYQNPNLQQTIHCINFPNPVGLSAGFDYQGHLTRILPYVGFGFESVGTVTFHPYSGNTPPRLSRLPQSKSLLVNKGFKTDGIQRLLNHNIIFPEIDFPIGISIGATNSSQISTPKTQKQDIIRSFNYLQSHPLYQKFAYYELNISCPNVAGSGSLAHPTDLKDILKQIQTLKLNRPLFVKFQLEIDWLEAKKLIKIMIDHGVSGIILSNLLKNRQDSGLNRMEIKQFQKYPGNFSGQPTWRWSNRLIGLTYQEFGKDLTIIGVGGIFSARDAYEKIKLGASLVQLITGMIYQGPQLIGSINQELVQLLRRDGYDNISQAVGAYYHH